MKTIHLLIAGLAFATALPSVHAQSPKSGIPLQPIRTKKHVDALGAGSQLVLVCKGSETATLIKLKDAAEAAELCREGHMVGCHDCRKKYRVIWRNPTGKAGGPDRIMEIVNSKGEPCMFLARIK